MNVITSSFIKRMHNSTNRLFTSSGFGGWWLQVLSIGRACDRCRTPNQQSRTRCDNILIFWFFFTMTNAKLRGAVRLPTESTKHHKSTLFSHRMLNKALGSKPSQYLSTHSYYYCMTGFTLLSKNLSFLSKKGSFSGRVPTQCVNTRKRKLVPYIFVSQLPYYTVGCMAKAAILSTQSGVMSVYVVVDDQLQKKGPSFLFHAQLGVNWWRYSAVGALSSPYPTCSLFFLSCTVYCRILFRLRAHN